MKALLLLVLTAFLAQAGQEMKRIPISESEAAIITYDKVLIYDLARLPEDQFQPTLRFQHLGSNGSADLSFRLFLNQDWGAPLTGQKEVDEKLTELAKSLREGSAEGEIRLRPIERKDGLAALCILKNASPAATKDPSPGTYRFLILGIVKLPERTLLVKGMTNEDQGAVYDAMIDLLKNIRIEKKSGYQSPK